LITTAGLADVVVRIVNSDALPRPGTVRSPFTSKPTPAPLQLPLSIALLAVFTAGLGKLPGKLQNWFNGNEQRRGHGEPSLARRARHGDKA
jgi:hypothetical protein